jgi:hypothetical protein
MKGTRMKKDIFRAENAALNRIPFTQVGATEWFEVYPRNPATGALDHTQLTNLLAT